MSAKVDEFKEFIKRHPLLKLEVMERKKTWQEIYEDYILLGEDSFVEYKEEKKTEKEEKPKATSSTTDDIIKQVMGYAKKLDPDTITKTVTSIQKVIELFSSFGGGASAGSLAKKSTGDPLFDKRFDEWY
jgi:hypothetical protein